MQQSLNEPRAREQVESYRQSFAVRYELDVHFTRDVFDPQHALFARALSSEHGPARFCVFLEDAVARAFPDLAQRIQRYAREHAITLAAPVELVVGGEDCKNDPALMTHLHAAMLRARIDRHAYAVVIGGGALLDAVGYAAATFHRGVRHVRLPTTVLAQCDSGVGVKNGINAFGLKNLLGTFAPPSVVINDALFLRSLPARDRTAGLAEAVKVALIRDGAFFAWLEQNVASLAVGEESALAYAIRRCAELHMRQIAHGGDPFERGSARPLDYGHWSAHKLESLTSHALRHGEAVAIGLALDTRYSVLSGMLAEGADERVCALLQRLGFTLWHDVLRDQDALLRGLEEFREHLGGALTITLLRELGVGEEVHSIDAALVADAIAWLSARRGAP